MRPNTQQSIFASIAMMAIVFAVFLSKPAVAQTFNSGKWVPNATVRAAATDATYTYIGGDFTSVCPPNARYGAKLTTTTVIPDVTFPAVNGTVNVCVPDGSGGWYIGGAFTQVGALTRNNLAQINSSGSVTSWDPNANNTINAITIDGSSIYVGGSFTSINGATTRNRLAKLNNTDGTADATWNPNANNTVYAIAVSGSTIYVGGIFTTINGATTRNLLARLNNTNGTADALWNPNVNTGSTVVTAIAISGTEIYIGGSFDQIHGYNRNGLAKMLTTDANGSIDLTWAASLQSLDTAFAIAISGSDIYVGGHFSFIYPSARNRLAKLNNTTGAVNATWDPNANGTVYSIAISGSDIFVGGGFTTINGTTTRNYLAKLNNTNGTADATWNPSSGNAVKTIASNSTDLYIGGKFTGVGATINRIARYNNSDGSLDAAWNPDVNNTVKAIALSGSDIYIGGSFTTINSSTTRNRLAKLSNASSTADATWNPNAGNTVNTIAISGSDIYIGGSFTTVNGATTRNRLAKLNNTNGNVDATWNPDANNEVYAVAINGSDVYVGGAFTLIHTSPFHNWLVKLNNSNGAIITAWDPYPNQAVYTIAFNSNYVYFGGRFSTVNGMANSRIQLAKVNNTTGTLDASWNPIGGNNFVYSIVISGGYIYAGGGFTTINGTTTRNHMVKLNNTNGIAESWDPNFNNDVYALASNGTNLAIGGAFGTQGGLPQNYFADYQICDLSISSQSTSAQTQPRLGAFSPITVTTVGTVSGYQWYSNTTAANSGGTSLGSADGAQTSSFTPPATVVGTRYYYCIVTGTCGTATSEVSGLFAVTAITITWDGSESTDWNTAENWNINVIPTVYDNVLVPDVTNDPTIFPTVEANCKTLTVNSPATLTIESGGSLIHNSAGVTATVKRIITGSSNLNLKKYHFVSIPTWYDPPTSNLFLGSYLYGLDPNQLNENSSYGKWAGLGISTTTTLEYNKGYMVYYPGASKEYTFTGGLYNGSYSYSLVGNPGASAYTFNLIPNPYPSAMVWNIADAAAWNKSASIGGTCYIWNAETGNYTSLISSATSYIPAGQAMMVVVENDASPYLVIKNNSVRTHSSQAFYKSSGIENQLTLKATSNNYADETVVKFAENATEDFDLQIDGLKINGLEDAPQLSTKIGETRFSINNLPVLQGQRIIDMNFSTQFAGQITFSASGIESFDPSINIYLKDELANQTINLRNQTVYTFNHNAANDASRFKLIFGGTNGIDERENRQENMWITGNTLYINTPKLAGEKAKVEVYNAAGQNLMAKTLVLSNLTTFDLNLQGFVIVKLTSGQTVLTAKGILLK